jgi:tetratricopeptide (TPR) repeat protein
MRLRAERPLSLFNLGQLAYQAGQYRRAERLHRRALAIWRDLGYAYGIALCLNELGVLHYTRGEDEAAEALIRESLAIRERIYDYPGIVRGLNNLALISDRLGRGDDVRTAFERSLDIARDVGDRRGVATALNNLGVFTRLQAEAQHRPELYSDAEQFLAAALDVHRDLGAQLDITLVQYNLADIAMARGDMEAARSCFLAVVERAAELGAVPLLLSTFLGLAKLSLRTGEVQLASRLLALVSTHPGADVEDRAEALRVLSGEELSSLDLPNEGPPHDDPAGLAAWLGAQQGGSAANASLRVA